MYCQMLVLLLLTPKSMHGCLLSIHACSKPQQTCCLSCPQPADYQSSTPARTQPADSRLLTVVILSLHIPQEVGASNALGQQGAAGADRGQPASCTSKVA